MHKPSRNVECELTKVHGDLSWIGSESMTRMRSLEDNRGVKLGRERDFHTKFWQSLVFADPLLFLLDQYVCTVDSLADGCNARSAKILHS